MYILGTVELITLLRNTLLIMSSHLITVDKAKKTLNFEKDTVARKKDKAPRPATPPADDPPISVPKEQQEAVVRGTSFQWDLRQTVTLRLVRIILVSKKKQQTLILMSFEAVVSIPFPDSALTTIPHRFNLSCSDETIHLRRELQRHIFCVSPETRCETMEFEQIKSSHISEFFPYYCGEKKF